MCQSYLWKKSPSSLLTMSAWVNFYFGMAWGLLGRGEHGREVREGKLDRRVV
jgi:hypothetical protein